MHDVAVRAAHNCNSHGPQTQNQALVRPTAVMGLARRPCRQLRALACCYLASAKDLAFSGTRLGPAQLGYVEVPPLPGKGERGDALVQAGGGHRSVSKFPAGVSTLNGTRSRNWYLHSLHRVRRTLNIAMIGLRIIIE